MVPCGCDCLRWLCGIENVHDDAVYSRINALVNRLALFLDPVRLADINGESPQLNSALA
jgi:hypothetical protein